MDNRSKPFKGTTSKANDGFNLDTLLHPAKAFRHPMDVVRDADLTLNEKRAILASWASDACAVEATPALRSTASGSAVSWDEIMDALRTLDGEAEEYRKPLPTTKPCWREDAHACRGGFCFVHENGLMKADH